MFNPPLTDEDAVTYKVFVYEPKRFELAKFATTGKLIHEDKVKARNTTHAAYQAVELANPGYIAKDFQYNYPRRMHSTPNALQVGKYVVTFGRSK